MFVKLVQSNFVDSIAYYFGIIKSFWSIKILSILTGQYHNCSTHQLHQRQQEANYLKKMHLNLLDELFRDEGSYGCTDETHIWGMK